MSSSSPRRTLSILAGGTLFAAWLGVAAGGTATDLPAGESAPLEPKRIEGEQHKGSLRSGSVADLRKWIRAQRGRPLVLNFWATWCQPCVEETAVFNEATRRFSRNGLIVMGVSLDGLTEEDLNAGRSKVERFVREHGIVYDTFYYDGDPEVIGDAFDLPGPIPYSLVLDAHGKVKRRLLGTMPKEVLLDRIAKAIGASAPSPDAQGPIR